MVRIIQICSNWELAIGGPPVAQRQLAKTIAENGNQIECFIVGKVEPFDLQNMTVSNVTISNVSSLFGNHHGFFINGHQSLYKKVKNSDVVIVHGFYLYTTVIAWLFSKLHNKKLILQPHGSLETYEFKKKWLKKSIFIFAIGNQILNYVSSIAVASRAELNQLCLNKFKKKCKIVGIGVSREFPTRLIKKRSKESSKFNIVMLGRLAKKKNIESTIESIYLLNNQSIQTKYMLTIAGTAEGQYARSLVESIQGMSGDSIRYIGPVNYDKRFHILSEADLLILASENENFAIVVAEALSVGTPVLVSKNVALSDLVLEYEAGIVVNSINSTSIASGIKEIELNYDKYFGNTIKIQQEFNWTGIYANWMDLIINSNRDFE